MGVKITKNFPGYLEQTTLICLHLFFLGFFPICNDIFLIVDQYRFFTSGISADIQMNVLKDCIICFIWAAWILFNVYLNPNLGGLFRGLF